MRTLLIALTTPLIIHLAGCGADSDSSHSGPDSAGGATASGSGAMSGSTSTPPGTGGSPAPSQSGGSTGASGGSTSATGGSANSSGGSVSATGGLGGAAPQGATGAGAAAGMGTGGSGVTPPPPPNGKADPGLIGFATYAAEGLKTTTGGDGGTVVTVTTVDDLVKYAGAAEAYVIQVKGTLTTSDAKYKKIRVTSNKTIVGVGADATLEHLGFDLTGWGSEQSKLGEFCEPAFKGSFAHVANVIIRNLHFKNTAGNSSDADGVVVQCYSHHVWVDHNTFYGQPSGNDGAIDIKRGSDWVTVSWNHIQAWDKAMLLGHVDTNEAQDSGTLHVSYHHNYLENTRQRHPRIRFAHAHVFNNLLYNDAKVANRTASYFLVAGVGSNVNAEGNLVQHAKEIYLVGEESDPAAKLTYAASNKAVALVSGAEALFHIQPNASAFDPKQFYSYTLEPADLLATSVPAGAGAGKLPQP